MAMVELADVSKSYADVTALANVSLSVDVGQIVALVGPNGAGKTTLVRIASALLPPDSGRVRVADVDACDRPVAARRHLALVPQGAAPDLNITPFEHVYYYLCARDLPRREARRRTDDVLEVLGLADHRDRCVHTLSGGYQRRVLIAMCLAARPRLLLLDEPTTALDPEVRRQTWQLLDELRQDSAVLVTTHDMTEAETIADRVVLLSTGRVAASDTAKRLIALLPLDQKIVVDAPREQIRLLLPGVRTEHLAGRGILFPAQAEQLRGWVTRLAEAGVSFAVQPCRLEDAYFHLLATRCS